MAVSRRAGQNRQVWSLVWITSYHYHVVNSLCCTFLVNAIQVSNLPVESPTEVALICGRFTERLQVCGCAQESKPPRGRMAAITRTLVRHAAESPGLLQDS